MQKWKTVQNKNGQLARLSIYTQSTNLLYLSVATVSYSHHDQAGGNLTGQTVYNVSQLLDSLLSNYDNSLRPDTGGG